MIAITSFAIDHNFALQYVFQTTYTQLYLYKLNVMMHKFNAKAAVFF